MSNFAAEVDDLYYVIYWISVIAFLAIVGLMTLYVWKYRRRPGHKPEIAGHDTLLEIGWTFSPLIVLGYLFVAGFATYAKMTNPPPDAMEIRVVASQWKWEFIHPNGATETNVLHVPVGRPVKMIMSSNDVLHSFYIPEFRVKRDVVPGMFSSLWFTATHETGEQPVTLFCAEYCGAAAGVQEAGHREDGQFIDNQNTNHSTMLAAVTVMAADSYDSWVREEYDRGLRPPDDCQADANPQACWGQKLYTQNCAACHSTDGAAGAGPTWRGLIGRTSRFVDGTSAVVDEDYIRESMTNPNARVVQGFAPVMPVQRMHEKKVNAIIAYMRTLR